MADLLQKPAIILVNDRAFIQGGVARVAIDEAIGLRSRGHDVTFFAAVGPADTRLLRAGVDVHILGQKALLDAGANAAAFSGILNHTAAVKLSALVSERKRERGGCLVHFHGWTKALSPAVLPVPRSLGVPCLMTAHDYFLACPNGGFLDYPKRVVCTRTPLSASCITCNCDSRSYIHKAWRVARQIYQNAILRSAAKMDVIASVSQFNQNRLKSHLPSTARLRVLHNPVEVSKMPPTRPDKSDYFLFVGRFSPEKGALDFAKAAALAGVNARFVGDGSEKQSIGEALPSADFRGWLGPEDVRREIRGARTLVFPSIWYESQPLTVVEALAEGVPVICSDVSAATEVVVAGKRGLHFKAGSPEALAVEIGKCSSDAVVQRMGSEAYDWYWKEPWSLGKHLDELEALYQECCHINRIKN